MIHPLTSLRFFFAFMVFGSHISILAYSESDALKLIYHNVLKEGYIGVTFFFILSGFILGLNYEDKFTGKKIDKRKFYLARIARIYPLHFLTFLCAIPLMINEFKSHPVHVIGKAFSNLTLTHAFIPFTSTSFSFNSPSWSISNEMFFYLLFPLIIIKLLPKILSKKIFIAMFFATIPILTLLVPKDIQYELFYINPIFRLFDFVLGVLLFKIYKILPNGVVKKSTLYELLSILCMVIFFSIHVYIPDLMRYSFYYWIPISILILTFSISDGIIARFFSKRTFIYLGEISFGFYLFHRLILIYFSLFNTKFSITENDYLIVIICFTTTVIVSHFGYIWFEKPLNKKIKHYFLSKG